MSAFVTSGILDAYCDRLRRCPSSVLMRSWGSKDLAEQLQQTVPNEALQIAAEHGHVTPYEGKTIFAHQTHNTVFTLLLFGEEVTSDDDSFPFDEWLFGHFLQIGEIELKFQLRRKNEDGTDCDEDMKGTSARYVRFLKWNGSHTVTICGNEKAIDNLPDCPEAENKKFGACNERFDSKVFHVPACIQAHREYTEPEKRSGQDSLLDQCLNLGCVKNWPEHVWRVVCRTKMQLNTKEKGRHVEYFVRMSVWRGGTCLTSADGPLFKLTACTLGGKRTNKKKHEASQLPAAPAQPLAAPAALAPATCSWASLFADGDKIAKERVEFHFQCQAPVGLPDNHLKTLLHHAAETGCFETLKLLVKNSACLEAIDEHGLTPIQYAERNGRERCLNYMQDYLRARATLEAHARPTLEAHARPYKRLKPTPFILPINGQ